MRRDKMRWDESGACELRQSLYIFGLYAHDKQWPLLACFSCTFDAFDCLNYAISKSFGIYHNNGQFCSCGFL